MPTSAWWRTTSSTSRRSVSAYASWSTDSPRSSLVWNSSSESGRIRLPTCVDRILSTSPPPPGYRSDDRAHCTLRGGRRPRRALPAPRTRLPARRRAPAGRLRASPGTTCTTGTTTAFRAHVAGAWSATPATSPEPRAMRCSRPRGTAGQHAAGRRTMGPLVAYLALPPRAFADAVRGLAGAAARGEPDRGREALRRGPAQRAGPQRAARRARVPRGPRARDARDRGDRPRRAGSARGGAVGGDDRARGPRRLLRPGGRAARRAAEPHAPARRGAPRPAGPRAGPARRAAAGGRRAAHPARPVRRLRGARTASTPRAGRRRSPRCCSRRRARPSACARARPSPRASRASSSGSGGSRAWARSPPTATCCSTSWAAARSGPWAPRRRRRPGGSWSRSSTPGRGTSSRSPSTRRAPPVRRAWSVSVMYALFGLSG